MFHQSLFLLDGSTQGRGCEDYWIKSFKIPQLGKVEANWSWMSKCSGLDTLQQPVDSPTANFGMFRHGEQRFHSECGLFG